MDFPSIDEILDMSVNEVIEFWNELGEVIDGVRSLQKVRLGYLKLGQGTSTLSGGEAARLKLAKELIRKKVVMSYISWMSQQQDFISLILKIY